MIALTVVNAGAVLGGMLIFGLLLAGITLLILLAIKLHDSGIPQPTHIHRIQDRHWTSADLLLVGGLTFSLLVVITGITIVLHQLHVSPRWLHITSALQNSALQFLVAGVILFQIRRVGSSLRGSFGDVDVSMRASAVCGQICKWYVGLLPLVFMAGLLSHALFAEKDGEGMFQPVLVMFSDAGTPGWFRWWIVGVAVIMAPIVEEAFFRGMLLPVLLRKYGMWVSLWACSLLFALVHWHVPAMLPLFVLGAGFGAAYLYTGNLLVPIGMHAVFNAVSLLVVLLSGRAETLQ